MSACRLVPFSTCHEAQACLRSCRMLTDVVACYDGRIMIRTRLSRSDEASALRLEVQADEITTVRRIAAHRRSANGRPPAVEQPGGTGTSPTRSDAGLRHRRAPESAPLPTKPGYHGTRPLGPGVFLFSDLKIPRSAASTNPLPLRSASGSVVRYFDLK
jgi:hypothetical protein